MSSAIVSCLVNPRKWLDQVSPENAVQVSRSLVQTSDGERSEQVLVWSDSGITDAVGEKLVADLEAEIPRCVSTVDEEVEGFAVVRSEDGSTLNAFDVAASVAVIKASWGWDEEMPIVVRVNEDKFEIYASFDGSDWIAR